MRRLIERLGRPSPLSARLAVFAVINAIFVNLLLLVLPTQNRTEVTPYHTAKFIFFRGSYDSWGPMGIAWDYLRSAGDHQGVYHYVFFERGVKFQYPLTSLFPVELMQLILRTDTVRFGPLNLLSWLAVWLTAVIVALIFNHAYKEHLEQRLGSSSRGDEIVRLAIAFGLTLTFYPIVKAFTLGQIQTWSNCLFALMILLWMKRRPVPAGLIAGLICIMKPQLGILLLWAALRKEWGFAGALAAVVALAFTASLALYGYEQNRDYVTFLSYMSRHGESYYANHSVNGFLHRLLHNGNNADFLDEQFAPAHLGAYLGTLASSVAIIAVALFWRRREHAAAGGFDLMIAALASTIASPIAWEHHYGLLMPMFAVLLPAIIRWPVFRGASLVVLGGTYVLSSNLFYITRYAAGTPFTPVQSYLLVAALLVFVMLFRVRAAQAREREAAEAAAVESRTSRALTAATA